METYVYRLYLEGVYEQGTCGLFATPEEAEEYAQELWNQSDGHHDFCIERLRVGERVPAETLPLTQSWEKPERIAERRAGAEGRRHIWRTWDAG